MNGLAEGIADAIAYMEAHLDGEMDMEQIAARAYISPFHFQRVFNILCGFTVGEYVRNRRLTLAAQELASSEARVIDVALKYGYDSPDSFAKAFQRFHGITPSQAREKDMPLRAFAPMKIKLKLEGGTSMEYRIVDKPQFTIVGFLRSFNNDTSYQEIPKFWQEYMGRPEKDRPICGAYGVCIDSHGKDFDYLIADDYVAYKDVPEGCVTRVIPAGTWAVFPCRGALPKALQDVNTRIWSEWLPGCREYALGGNYSIEMYTPPKDNPADDYNEIWLPVKKI